MIWFQLFLWVATFIVSDYFRERLPSVTASGVGDFNIPTATEGRVVPIAIGGRMRCNSPNCIWYGDFAAEPITVETGVIFTRDETVGFNYKLALQYALFKTKVAGITGVWIGDDEVYRGVPLTVVDIDRPDLFGGEMSGGGFVGRLRLFDGDANQGVSTFLSTRVDPLSAYRGTCYVMITNVAETEGASIGESNQLRHIRIEVQTYDTIANGGLNNTLGLANDEHIIGVDSNPMSVAYELYVNTDWGRRFPPGDVDAVSFAAAATVCFNEGIGFGMVIDELTTTGAIQDIIEQHIDGYIGPNPLTGKIEVTLARQDYVLADEFQATPDNIIDVKKWNRGDWSQTFNKIRVRYADRNKQWKESHAVEVASGNRIIQGKNKVRDLRYAGIHEPLVASKIAARAKRNLSQPIDSGTLVMNRTAYALRPGSVMSVTDPRIDGVEVPVRVTRVKVGEITMNSIEVDVVLDVFDSETTTVAAPPATDFVPPTQGVVAFAAADQAATEAPFTLMRYDSVPNSIPRIATFARRTGGAPTEYEVIRRTRALFGTGAYGAFASSGFVTAGFMTVGTLRNAEGGFRSGNGGLTMQIDPITGSLDGLIGDYTPSIGNAAGVAVISPGLADEEWIAFTSIVDDLAGIRLEGLYRGAMDTGMESHLVGARVWFVWTGGMGMTSELYTPGNGAELKLLPRSPNESILEAAATALPEVHVLNTPRNARPLLPRTVSINGTEFPTTAQSADFVAQSTPSVINGLLFSVTPRMWNTQDVLWQVQGLDLSGGSIATEDWSPQNTEVEYWLYDLDATPSPTRGVDELVTGTFVWDEPSESFIVSLADLLSAGVVGDFEARLEIETEHSPGGQTANQISRKPLFFDFDVTGSFALSGIVFPYSEVAFHSHFDGTDTATTSTDESDQAATITFNNNAQLDTAQSVFGGSSLLCDGTNDYVSCPNDPIYGFGSNDFTVQARIRFASVTGVMAVCGFWDWNGGNTDGVWIVRQNHGTNQMDFTFTTNGTTAQQSLFSWTPAQDTWYAIEITRIGSLLYFFVDGVLISSNAFTATLFTSVTAELWVGAWNGASPQDDFDGWIDELRIINGTGLNDASYIIETRDFGFHRCEFLASFNGADAATTFTDESKNAATLTFRGNAQIDTSEFKFGGSSLLLDGSGDFVTLPNSTAHDLGANDFTVEAHIRFNSLAVTSQVIMGKYNATDSERQWFLARSGDNLRFVYTTNTGGSNTDIVDRLFGTWAVDTWYHVAVSRVGNNLRFFVDGALLGAVHDMTGDTINAETTNFAIGSTANGETVGSDFFNGWIDEPRLIVGEGLYDAAFTAPNQPFSRVQI